MSGCHMRGPNGKKNLFGGHLRIRARRGRWIALEFVIDNVDNFVTYAGIDDYSFNGESRRCSRVRYVLSASRRVGWNLASRLPMSIDGVCEVSAPELCLREQCGGHGDKWIGHGQLAVQSRQRVSWGIPSVRSINALQYRGSFPHRLSLGRRWSPCRLGLCGASGYNERFGRSTYHSR